MPTTWRAPASPRCCAAAPQRVYHASDDSELQDGRPLRRVADPSACRAPPRIAARSRRATLSPMQWSFMSESRRLDNTRLKRELRVRLRYPTRAAAALAVRRRFELS